jgi:hypothetical protein
MSKDFSVQHRRKGKEVVLSPRPADWSSYLAEAPLASADFMEGVEDLRVQGAEAVILRYMLNTDTCSYIMKRSTTLSPIESGSNRVSGRYPGYKQHPRVWRDPQSRDRELGG